MNGIATGDCNKTISLIKQNQAEFKCNLIKCFLTKKEIAKEEKRKGYLMPRGGKEKVRVATK